MGQVGARGSVCFGSSKEKEKKMGEDIEGKKKIIIIGDCEDTPTMSGSVQ